MRTLLFILLTLPGLAKADLYKTEVVAEGLSHPWSIDFLPDGDYLVAMKSGEVRQISASGKIGDIISGGPTTHFESQGGYFDILLDPAFRDNNTVYLCYAGGPAEANATTIMKARLLDNSFQDTEIIYRATPTKDTPAHYGGKMHFLDDGTLLVTTGDGFEYREAAQDTHSHLGKLIRINTDGIAPPDNPFADGNSGDPKVYSYGHRNPQGLDVTSDGTIYLHEHGPKGGDELNRIEAGANYGWPAVTYGDNYSGAYVSPLKEHPGTNQPEYYWVPSIAPSGLVIYEGDMFPEWQGDFLVGALVDEEVRRLVTENGRIIQEQPLFAELAERIRDIREAPDGELYILTDGEGGKVIRVTRK
ncbi:MAG: PQQ-dependent sugar dehydrogenase [Pseudomonadales bacterium]|nr:PQQ-dependent sugar dehydrogenase [Pseudomonadales bacterium]